MMKSLGSIVSPLLQLAILALLGVIIWQQLDKTDTPLDDAPYAAVTMTNGLVYFGRVDHATSEYLHLDDPRYIDRRKNPKTGTINNLLVKRARQALHRPPGMIIPVVSILFVEPIDPNSQIGKQLRGD